MPSRHDDGPSTETIDRMPASSCRAFSSERRRWAEAAERIRTVDLRFTKPLLNSTSNDDTATCESASTRLASSLATILQEHAELTAVVEAWPGLPEAVRAGILAMVKASVGRA